MSETTVECLESLTCATCGEKKPTSYFHQRARSKTGYAPSCRPCTNRKRRNKKNAPTGDSSRLKTLVKKGDLQNLQNLIEQTATRSFNSLLKTCVTPYISFPKTAAHPEVARYLIEQGADPNARGREGESMLCLAASAGLPALVNALVDHGARVDFFSAAAILDLTAVENALGEPSQATAIDNTGRTGLHYCAGSALGHTTTTHHKQQLAIIDRLLHAGAEPNAEVDIGIAVTPLVACCQSAGTVAVVHALVRGGADPNQQQVLRSALRHCKNRRNPENSIADALIKSGGLVDALIDEQNRTCLHLYSHHEEIQAVHWLLDAGASVHARTKDGRTPLHLAADRNNNTMVCTLLLAHGANSEAIDTLGKRPVDYARENHKTKIIALLDRQ